MNTQRRDLGRAREWLVVYRAQTGRNPPALRFRFPVFRRVLAPPPRGSRRARLWHTPFVVTQ